MNAPTNLAIADLLAITPEQISLARHEANQRGTKFIEHLEQLCSLTPETFTEIIGRIFDYPVLTSMELNKLKPDFEHLPFAEATQRGCILFYDGNEKHIMVFADPFSSNTRAWAEERVRYQFSWALAHHSDITAYLAHYESSLRAMDDVVIQDETHRGAGTEELSLRSINDDTSPVVKLVHSTLYDALKIGASDVHLETTPNELHIKYRVDGVLTPVGKVPGSQLAQQVISRIKVMSELDIAERRVPQDGRFKVSVKGREIDFRVSIMPSSFGEDAVLRILDKQALSDQAKGLRLDYLGFDTQSMATIRRLSAEPYGMILVTGPTGSGKTTTLYAAISEINNGQDKIVTIEDPIEYQLPGVLQIPVNEKKGLTFARGLRSILRHDPDKIMVGEIRDPETAQIAVQAALTGHLVFTTVHANNALDVLSRFVHMGVDPYNLVAALNGVLAQRLVRINCPHCIEAARPSDELLVQAGINLEDAKQFQFLAGQGCGQCRGIGYKGRKAISEFLVLNDEIREMIVSREPIRKIKEAAQRNGTRFLRDSAIECVRDGETTLAEINRVTVINNASHPYVAH